MARVLLPPPSHVPLVDQDVESDAIWKSWLETLYSRTNESAHLHSTTITSSYTVADTDYIFADATSGNITITLNDPSENDRQINVKKVDSSANTVTLDAGTTNIDGATTLVISAQYDSYTVHWDGTQWWIV